jgi:hypothetical protein
MRIKNNWRRLTAFITAATFLPVIAAADFLTAEPPFITLDPGVPAGSSVLAIISSGESINGFRFQGLPDGIGLAPDGLDGHGDRWGGTRVDVYVVHEETTVPFFNSADFQDASISRLTLNTTTGAVTEAAVVLGPEEGFLRFCSASMAGPVEGLSRYTFFAGEETNDIVDVPAVSTYGPDPAIAPQRQGGYAVIVDAASGAFKPVLGMGRMNHENTVVVPGGWVDKIAMVTTDDTFSAPSAQLYMYLARSEKAIWRDRGNLWAFRVTHTDDGRVDATDPFNDANDYLDIQPGDDWRGRFIRVPRDIARGETGDAPQDALEDWSNDNNIFQFIRLEDLAVDKRYSDDWGRVVYVADTGRSRIIPDPTTGRMMRGPSGTVGSADNGRIYKFVFNANNPRKVDSFSVLADGDAPGTAEFVPMVNPDNMDTSQNSIMVQEDTDNAKIWQLDFGTGTWSVAATVNDPDGESSGIVDASDWFGAGSWILDVQGHGNNVIEEVDAGGIRRKLESGQLLLMNIPGS